MQKRKKPTEATITRNKEEEKEQRSELMALTEANTESNRYVGSK
jgi:hypothetical protein